MSGTVAPTASDAAERTGASRVLTGAQAVVRVSRWEIVPLLSVVLFLIMLIPERLVFHPLGAAGRPGVLLAIVCFLLWINVTLVRGMGGTERNATARVVITLFAICVLISYVVAMSRPIVAVEARSADRSLLNVAAWAGLWLLSAEGTNSEDRLETILRRLAIFGAIMGSFGIFQFLTGVDLTTYVHIPGLSGNSDAESLSRNGFNRPAGTASHPIEFGVIMAMLIPLAMHQLAFAPDGKRNWARLRLLLLAVAAVMSVSRSAVLGIIVAGVMLVPNLPKAQRRQLLKATPFFLVAIKFLAPGLLGTLLKLFTGIGSDDSAASRTDSYAAVGTYIAERPVFGRGLGTFLPSYHILDNQLLGLLIEVGAVGLLAVLILLFTGPVVAWRAGRRTRDPKLRSLGISLSASAAVVATSFATFDALGFSIVACLTFFIGGCCCSFACLTTDPDPEVGPQTSEASNNIIVGVPPRNEVGPR